MNENFDFGKHLKLYLQTEALTVSSLRVFSIKKIISELQKAVLYTFTLDCSAMSFTAGF